MRRVVIALCSVGVAIVLTAIARRGADVTPTSDTAVIESFTLLAAKGRLLLGPYSRFQWHHPGPLYFFWMAPFYAGAGYRTAGLYAGALALNLAALFLIFQTITRRAGSVAALCVSASIALFVWRAADVLTSPWNPHITVISTMALVVVAADVIAETPAMLPTVAALASLIGQTHVGLLPSALAVGAAATLGSIAMTRWRRSTWGHALTRSIVATAVVLVVLWLPPFLEQLTSTHGNLGQLWTFFVREPRTGQSFKAAVSGWADMLTGVVRPDFSVAQGWRFQESPVKWAEPLAFAQMLALAALIVISARARRRFELTLGSLLMLVSGLALWSATHIEGAIFDHEIFWMAGLGTLNLGLMVAIAAQYLATRRRQLALSATLSAGICWSLALALTMAGVERLVRGIRPAAGPGAESQLVAALATDVQAYLDQNRIARPLIRIDQDTWGIAAGVILRLQKAGTSLSVEDDWLPMFTPVFAMSGKEDVALMIAGKAQHVRMAGTPGDLIVTAHDPIYVHRTGR